MTDELRTTLHRLADDATPRPVADDLWRRGRAARRRGQAFAVAAALALVVSVGGAATLLAGPDRETRTASTEEVPEGAIPSRIETTNVPFETELPVGRASVAFFASGGITVIGAEDGRYHQFAPDDPRIFPAPKQVLALSPDGEHLAWAAADRIAIGDLMSGEVVSFAHNGGSGADVNTLTWLSDSTTLHWTGTVEGTDVGAAIDVTGPSEFPFVIGRYGTRGIPSPGSDAVALPSRGEVAAAPFLAGPVPGEAAGRRLERSLPTDLYPTGAVVRPLGWAENDLVVAVVDPPQSDVVERPRLAIFTSPDQPESEWVWREFLPRLPPVESLSIAVDLVPNLTGDPQQELTHDFDDPSADQNPLAWTGIEVSLLIGLGVAAAIAVLMALRWLWRRIWRRLT
ncbi:MAG TPA: hypothetical protein VEW73_13320 [Nocardioides sp.]|nr:hypothetical protein [Nocardioides sp.]